MKRIIKLLFSLVLGISILRINVTRVSAEDIGVYLNDTEATNISIVDYKGKTHSISSFNTDYTVLVFGRQSCGNTNNALSTLENLKKKGYKFTEVSMLVDSNDISSTIEQYQKQYPNAIVSDKYSYNNSLMWSLVRRVQGGGSVIMPVCVIVDKSSRIQYYVSGADSGNGLMRALAKLTGNITDYENLTVFERYHIRGTYNYDYAKEVVRLMNIERKKEGLSPLIMDAELLEGAMQRGAEISFYFSHTRPNETSCFTISDKAKGENIAAWQRSPADVMDSWMNSDGHRANILTPEYKIVGVGAYTDGNTYYWVQLFGTDKATSSSKSGKERKSIAVDVMSTHVTPAFNETTSKIYVNETKQLTTSVDTDMEYYMDVLAKTYKWSSSNTSIASVDQNGKVTGKKAGEVTITASNKQKPSIKITTRVKVYQHVQSVAIQSGLPKEMNAGTTYTLKATVSPSGVMDSSVRWSTSNSSIATVSQSGVVTAKKPGTATITVTTNDGQKKASVTVKVIKKVKSISLDATSMKLNIGSTKKVKVTFNPIDASNKKVTWKSSNTKVATVDANGKVTAKAKGTATITVTTEDGKKTATCKITVKETDGCGFGTDNVSRFVERLYVKCLNRCPDKGGFNYWAGYLKAKKITAAEAVQGFFESNEMKNAKLSNADFIERCYVVLMDRKSDAGGKKYWLDKMSKGMSKREVLQGFVDSNEFIKICKDFNIARGSIKK